MDSQRHLIDIVIPTYNNQLALDRLLAVLRLNTYHSWTAIIIENGSAPMGWTKPTNKGVLAATADITVVMNDDCVPQRDWDIGLCRAIWAGAWVSCPHWEDHEFTGHCFAMSREARHTLFPLPERYVFWQSDAVLVNRLRVQHGQKPVRVKDSLVLHDFGDPLRTSNRAEMLETVQTWITRDNETAHGLDTERKV